MMFRQRRDHRCWSGQRGLAAVEFAIALAVLMAVMLATAEFARAFSQYNTLTKTTRDGVRYLAGRALQGTTGTVEITASLETETKNLVVYGNAVGAGAPLLEALGADQVDVTGSAANGTVTVSVDYPYQPMLGAVLPMFGVGADQSLAFNLRSTVVMRAL
jgi:Flp pilus assembly protein TadG